MRKSIYIRNFCMTASIVFLSFLFLCSVYFVWSYRLIMGEKQKAMSLTAEDVVSFIKYSSMGYDVTSTDFRVALSTISHSTGFDILITNANGVVISCSDSQFMCPHIGKVVPPDILSHVSGGSGFVRTTNLGGIFSDIRYVMGLSIVRVYDNNLMGYMFLSSTSNDMVQLWRQFAGVFLMISAAVLFLTFVISFITTKKQAEPLNEMANAARRFARGDFSVRVEDSGRIDEIGQLTEAFNYMADSLERSEKLRSDFIANVSHELKTPMTVISGFSDGILDGTIPPENQRKYLEIISSETKRLSRLVRNMLDISRIHSTTPEALRSSSFDISEVIRLSLLSLGGKIDTKGLDVKVELPEEAIKTRGDKDAITQVVYNLIDNAIKFADKDSTIRVSLWKQGQRVFVSVENRGITIPAEEMPLIFDRFHKTDRSRNENRDGIGLGLYIVKTILDNHNEDIFVTSSNGTTRFTFTLTLTGLEKSDGRSGK
jgi:signal transduction histidine kinase